MFNAIINVSVNNGVISVDFIINISVYCIDNICFTIINFNVYIFIDLINNLSVVFTYLIINCCVDVVDSSTNFTFQLFDCFFIIIDVFFVIADKFTVFYRNGIVESNIFSVFVNLFRQVSNRLAVIVNVNSQVVNSFAISINLNIYLVNIRL